MPTAEGRSAALAASNFGLMFFHGASIAAQAGRPGIERRIDAFSQQDARPSGLGYEGSFGAWHHLRNMSRKLNVCLSWLRKESHGMVAGIVVGAAGVGT